MPTCAPVGFVLALAALRLAAVLARPLLHAMRRPHAADDARPRAALLVVALGLALAASVLAIWCALSDLGIVGGAKQYPLSLVLASSVVGLLSAAIAVQKLAVPRAARTENDHMLLLFSSLLAFAVAGCYGILAVNG